MRPPRYRFPEEVRTTTRLMATRMVRDGTVPDTPEALERWIADAPPDVREPLDRGGYGDAFSADDLFPLLQVFVEKAGGAAPEPDAPARTPARMWLVGLAVLIVAAILVMIVARVGFSQSGAASASPAAGEALAAPGLTPSPAPPTGG